MKLTIKKILRLFLVFLSSFALVLCWLPAEAQANEYDGNDYTYVSKTVDLAKLWAAKIYQQMESVGYSVSSKITEWTDEMKETALYYGVNVYNAAGEFIDDGTTYVNTVTGLVIDYTNPYVQEFIQGAENWDITDKSADTWDFYYNLYRHLYTFSDTLTLDSYFENPNAFSASGRDNIKKYFSFKNFGLSRGSYDDILGSNLNPDYFHPTQIDLRFGTSYPTGQTSADYSVPVDGSETFSQGIGNNGFVDVSWNRGSCDFEVTANRYSEVNCYIRLFGCEPGDTFSIVNADRYSNIFRIETYQNCTISDSGVVTVVNNNDGWCMLFARWYGDSHSTGNNYYFELKYNVLGESVIAPDPPVYKMPDPTSSNYEQEKQNYDYFKTETDRILDEYDIASFMSDIRNTFDDTPWLFYPIEFYNEVATVLTDNYSDTFDFTLEEMNFSSIADGFIIPHKEFHFDPDTLPNTVKVLFRLFQWIITFSYFWALINWGRSLILRFGSDSTHIDYEDN